MRILFTLGFLGFQLAALSQKADLSPFDALIGKTWLAEGTWGDGTKFKQETTISYALNNSIVMAHSKGYTNQEQTQYGDRNIGIRRVDSETGKLVFTEYDVFGGKTDGEIIIEGRNLIYTYKYGEYLLADVWEYVDENTYKFTVGDYSTGEIGTIFLSTQFKEVSD